MSENIHQRLLKARADFHKANMPKSGYNSFSGYNYFELVDIVPVSLRALENAGLCHYISMNRELATMTLVNASNPEEKIEFTAPWGSATLKAAHDVQNVGASITYMRRYLYQMLWDIVEKDEVDASAPVRPDPKGEEQKAVKFDANPYDAMEAATSLSELQSLFGDFYRQAAGNKALQESLAAAYNEKKRTFAE